MCWATFWAIFSQTHLVTLVRAHNLNFDILSFDIPDFVLQKNRNTHRGDWSYICVARSNPAWVEDCSFSKK
jgi:hypothetical protein